ncbi:hypothetical protein DPMN_189322 [Dreissena polymorpha]|uniref:Uncharacterized protein n=1 Tax=Dreissena polymorpha TaxID=45954 RepID=A0A9D4DSK8_DREPO|nr:hypothetical protein DPMN_189322 [Dreissena polymorpha]
MCSHPAVGCVYTHTVGNRAKRSKATWKTKCKIQPTASQKKTKICKRTRSTETFEMPTEHNDVYGGIFSDGHRKYIALKVQRTLT